MATPPPQLVLVIVADLEKQVQRYLMGSRQPFGVDPGFMTDMPDIHDDRTVDLVLDTCLQRGLQSCACLAAVFYDRVEELLRSVPSLVPDFNNRVWREALVTLAQEDRWSSVQALLTRGTGRVCLRLLKTDIQVSMMDHPTALTVLDTMGARCIESDCSCINDYVRSVVWWGLADRLKILVEGQNTNVRRVVLDLLGVIVSQVCRKRHDFSLALTPNMNDCLTVACEAGLFTMGTSVTDERSGLTGDRLTAMAWAVTYNQPDVVSFLYHAGAASDHELYRLSRDPYLEDKVKAGPSKLPQWSRCNTDYPSLDNVDAVRSIQSFLTRVASTSRSLETLCLLQVSRQLGWGHGRESRIEQLEMADTLKEDLQFRDKKLMLKYPSINASGS